MSFTYAQLQTAIQDYTENSETSFVSNLSTFITQAEERILKSVQLSLFRKNVSGGMTNANRFLACPSDYLAPFSLSFVDASSDVACNFLDFGTATKSVGNLTINPTCKAKIFLKFLYKSDLFHEKGTL